MRFQIGRAPNQSGWPTETSTPKTHVEATLARKEDAQARPQVVESPHRVSGEKLIFFCFEAGINGRVQCQVTHFTTQNTDTRPQHRTTQDCTLQANMPQDGCPSTPKVAGLMSPATPYKSTQQDEHLQHFRTS